MFMSGKDYRESLTAYKPSVYVNGRRVKSVANDADLAPGVNAIGLTYDYALKPELAPLMRATQHTSGREVSRLIHLCRTSGDLLNKLEAVRLVCQETGCAQRYLTGDAFNALFQATHRTDAETASNYQQRFCAFMHDAQARGEIILQRARGVCSSGRRGCRRSPGLRPRVGPARALARAAASSRRLRSPAPGS